MFMFSKNIIVEKVLLVPRARVCPVIHIIRRGRQEKKWKVYNLREIEFLFLISYISVISKFILTLFGSIYYRHSFNKNVCGLGIEALGSYVKWQILNEYYSMYTTVLSFLTSNTSNFKGSPIALQF